MGGAEFDIENVSHRKDPGKLGVVSIVAVELLSFNCEPFVGSTSSWMDIFVIEDPEDAVEDGVPQEHGSAVVKGDDDDSDPRGDCGASQPRGTVK